MFLYPNPPPLPLVKFGQVNLPPPPPPIATAATEVTPVGATQEKVPAVVNVAQVATGTVTLLEAALAGPVPAPFIAWTTNVYAVPLVNPVTVSGDVAPVPVMPSGEDVAL